MKQADQHSKDFLFLKHEEEVRKRHPGNVFAKHLALHHPEQQGDITRLNITVISSFKKPLTRTKFEPVMIRNSEADYIMNSKGRRQKKYH